jgi:hypothetical protein
MKWSANILINCTAIACNPSYMSPEDGRASFEISRSFRDAYRKTGSARGKIKRRFLCTNNQIHFWATANRFTILEHTSLANAGEKCKVAPVLTWSSTTPWMWMCGRRHSCTILDVGTRQWWVVSFTFQLLYPEEIASATHCIGNWVVLTTGLVATEKRIIFPLLGTEPRPSSSRPIDIMPEVYRLS